jgi:uncharacterized protein YndB with AHSA1/START domain
MTETNRSPTNRSPTNRSPTNRRVETRGRELVLTRILDAPRALVFQAWTDPARLAQWMGPRGYTATDLEHDLRPGGAWRTCLRPDDGGDNLWQSGVYREIVEPERLVFTFAWDGPDGRPGHETLVTVTLADEAGKTKMTFHQAIFESVERRDSHQGGWSSAFDRLEEHLTIWDDVQDHPARG